MTDTREDLDRAAGTDDETIGLNLTLEIAALEDDLRRLRLERVNVIRRLVAAHGVAKTARIVGVSESTVKTARGHPQTHAPIPHSAPQRTVTRDCELNRSGCTHDARYVEDPYEADVNNNPGQYIWACDYCLNELALDI